MVWPCFPYPILHQNPYFSINKSNYYFNFSILLYAIVYEVVAEKVVIALKLDNAVINSLSVIKTNTDPRVYNVDPRRYHSLSFRIEGDNVIYEKNGVEITSNARSLTFVPAGIPYTHQVLTPSQQIVVHFTTL